MPMGIATFNPADLKGLDGIAGCLEEGRDPMILHWEGDGEPAEEGRIPKLLETLLLIPRPLFIRVYLLIMM